MGVLRLGFEGQLAEWGVDWESRMMGVRVEYEDERS